MSLDTNPREALDRLVVHLISWGILSRAKTAELLGVSLIDFVEQFDPLVEDYVERHTLHQIIPPKIESDP